MKFIIFSRDYQEKMAVITLHTWIPFKIAKWWPLILFPVIFVQETAGQTVSDCVKCVSHYYDWSTMNNCYIKCGETADPRDFMDAFDVSFVANSGEASFSPGTVIKYNHVRLDLRNGYNVSSGYFTASVSGVYHLTMVVRAKSDIQLAMRISRVNVNTTEDICEVQIKDYQTASCDMRMQMAPGDMVHVVSKYFNPGVMFAPTAAQNKLSGHLIYAL